MLARVTTLGDRVAHALAVRGMKPAHVDAAVAIALRRSPKALNALTSDVIKGTRKPTSDVLAALAVALDVSSGWLLDESGAMDRVGETAPTFDSLPGWGLAAQAEIERDRVRPYVIRAAGRAPASVRPAHVTPDFVFSVAMLWLEYAPEAERRAAAEADATRPSGS